MLTSINPKLPMRDKATTRDFYLNKLGFQEFGSADFDGYLMVEENEIIQSFSNERTGMCNMKDLIVGFPRYFSS